MTKQIKNTLSENTSLMVTRGVSDESGLEQYIRNVLKFPILSQEEEYEYATKWLNEKDESAAEKLISSHLRLVVSVAYDFKNYGIPVGDLIASGNMGLMQAVQKFDPERGFRFSTYAMFWVKAEIYENILNNWSMVKIGTSANQKKVFFNLSRAKKALGILNNNMTIDQVADVAKYLDVPEKDVVKMSARVGARDLSLNAPMGGEGETDMLSNLSDNKGSVEETYEKQEYQTKGHKLIAKHLLNLPERDREILYARRLQEPVRTLESLSQKYGVSRERIRQIEERAYEKLKSAILADTKGEGL